MFFLILGIFAVSQLIIFFESFTIPEEETELKGSTGKSGSMFYSTKDGNFFYKTLLHPEVGTMLKLLPNYYEHLKNYKNSLVMKMYGLFRCTLGVDKMWILIMGSVFPKGVKMHEIYDLKGKKPKPGKSVVDRGVVSKILKDNDIKRHMFLDEEDKIFFINQLDQDIELLRNHNIMDYSLLIGIHKPFLEEDNSDNNSNDSKKNGIIKKGKESEESNEKKLSNSDEIQSDKKKENLLEEIRTLTILI